MECYTKINNKPNLINFLIELKRKGELTDMDDTRMNFRAKCVEINVGGYHSTNSTHNNIANEFYKAENIMNNDLESLIINLPDTQESIDAVMSMVLSYLKR